MDDLCNFLYGSASPGGEQALSAGWRGSGQQAIAPQVKLTCFRLQTPRFALPQLVLAYSSWWQCVGFMHVSKPIRLGLAQWKVFGQTVFPWTG